MMRAFLYRARVMHHRMAPKRHRFHYNVFLFCINLDSLDADLKKIKFISRNRFGLFSFYDRDHLEIAESSGKSVRENLNRYLAGNGITTPPARVELITNLRVLGYVFNPVSFYFCYDDKNKPVCAVVEVMNTYREMKVYLLGGDSFRNGGFHLRTKKYFYVSPFIASDAEFDFQLMLPSDALNIRIDDFKDDQRFFISTLTGAKKDLTDARLIGYFFRFPFITIQVITLIHWNALLLWMKKVRHYPKAGSPELQRDILNKK